MACHFNVSSFYAVVKQRNYHKSKLSLRIHPITDFISQEQAFSCTSLFNTLHFTKCTFNLELISFNIGI